MNSCMQGKWVTVASGHLIALGQKTAENKDHTAAENYSPNKGICREGREREESMVMVWERLRDILVEQCCGELLHRFSDAVA